MTRLFLRSRPRRLAGGPSATMRPLGGAFLGNVPESLPRGTAMETWLDAPLDCQTLFEPWDDREAEIADLFDRLTEIWTAGRMPLLTWEAFTPTAAATPPDILSRIARGEYDEYIATWAEELRAWVADSDDRRVYLRPLHEPNGDWYPWAPTVSGADPALYARVWRRIHHLVHDAGVPRSQVCWIWAVNHIDVGDVPAEAMFPGDTVVDLIGIDGFNWGVTQPWSGWLSPVEVFEEMCDRMEALSDSPLCIPEFGSSSVTAAGPDSTLKSRWLRDAFAYFGDRNVHLAVYFDIEKETDWQVFGGANGANSLSIDGTRYQTYPGFRAGYRQFIGL